MSASCRSQGAVSALSHPASQRCLNSNRWLSGTRWRLWSTSCFLFLFLRSLDWRRDQGGSGSTGPSVDPPKRGSMEPLPESDKKAARQEPARDELSLAWDETLTNNPMPPHTRPHGLRAGSCSPPKAVPNQRPRIRRSRAVPGPFPRFCQGSPESASPLLRC